MTYPFVQAKHYTAVAARPITLLVLHTMEAPEKPGTARSVAAWFAGSNAPQASAHYCIDDSDIIQCVKEHDVAWAAPGANRQGIHLEHAGYAKQSSLEWVDAYSEAMLHRSAQVAAEICTRNHIPVRFVPAADLLAGAGGITTHVEVSRAWRQSDHTDPGPSFPMAHYLNLVIEASAPKGVAPMYSPPIGPIAAAWLDDQGHVISAISPAGEVFWGKWWGNVAGKPYWGNRSAALIGARPDGQPGYRITSTDGATYDLPDGIDKL